MRRWSRPCWPGCRWWPATRARSAETLDGAGVLLGSTEPTLVAGTIERLVNDAALRAAVLARQQALAARIRSTDYRRLVFEALAPVLGAAA